MSKRPEHMAPPEVVSILIYITFQLIINYCIFKKYSNYYFNIYNKVFLYDYKLCVLPNINKLMKKLILFFFCDSIIMKQKPRNILKGKSLYNFYMYLYLLILYVFIPLNKIHVLVALV